MGETMKKFMKKLMAVCLAFVMMLGCVTIRNGGKSIKANAATTYTFTYQLQTKDGTLQYLFINTGSWKAEDYKDQITASTFQVQKLTIAAFTNKESTATYNPASVESVKGNRIMLYLGNTGVTSANAKDSSGFFKDTITWSAVMLNPIGDLAVSNVIMQANGTKVAEYVEPTGYEFEYTFVGQTADTGEAMYKVEINTGELSFNASDVTTETFYVNQQFDKKPLLGSLTTTNTKFYPTSVSVSGNLITLYVGEKGVADETDPMLFDSYTELLGAYEKYTMTLVMEKAIGDVAPSSVTLIEDIRINEDAEIFEARWVQASTGVNMPYRYWEPNVPDGKTAPMIVWLNTSAETGTDNYKSVGYVPVWKFTQNSVQSLFGDNGAFIVAVQTVGILDMKDGTWGEKELPVNIMTAIEDAIAKANGKVDTNRIYVCGGSLGGLLTTKMVANYPEFFAAAVPCSTGSILQDAAGDVDDTDDTIVTKIANVNVPIYWVHAFPDPTNNVQASIHGWISYQKYDGDGTLALANNVSIEGYTEKSDYDLSHETWLYLFNNFDGTEQDRIHGGDIWVQGSGSHASQNYGTLEYTSTMPKDAKGNAPDIMSWMAMHKKEYSITYYDGDTQITSLTKNTYKPNETFTLETPAAREGYRFVGWYDNENLVGEMVTEISRDKFDKTYYAKWELDTNLVGLNVSLNGTIAAKFIYELPDAYTAQEGAYLSATIGSQESKLLVSEAEKDAAGRYVFTVRVASAQMAEKINLQLKLADGTAVGSARSYAVKDYADWMLANGSEKQQNLVKAMLNYGAYSQIAFNYNTDALANVGLYEDGANPVETETFTIDAENTTNGEVTGLAWTSYNCSLNSDTAIRLYFTPEEGVSLSDYTFTVTFDDMGLYTLKASIAEDGRWYIDITDIPAPYLDTVYTVAVTNKTDKSVLTVETSVLAYIADVLESESTSEAQKNAVKALYLYNVAANAFFGD